MSKPAPTEAAASKVSPPARKPRRWIVKLTLAVLSPAIFLILCELVLAAAGVRVPRYHPVKSEIDYWIPFEAPGRPPGFQRVAPRDFKNYPEPLPLFARDKPSNGFRIFTLGESTVQGSPYEIGSFTDWLRVRLSAMMPDRAVESVNAGNAGWHAAEIRTLLGECLNYKPDLIIWMVGHNEFVPQNLVQIHRFATHPILTQLQDFARGLRTTQLLARAVPGIVQTERITLSDRKSSDDVPCVNDAELQVLLDRYKDCLRGAIRDAKRAGVPIVVCTMPRNLRCTPSGSFFSTTLQNDANLKKTWIAKYTEGAHALAQKKAAVALQRFDEIRAIDDTPAKLHYSTGQAFEMLGRKDDARAEYIKSLELDACPNRALPSIEQIIREEVARGQVPLCDLERVFNAAGGLGVAGDELIFDNVHPSLKGHEKIADELIRVLEKDLNLQLDRSRDLAGKPGREKLGLDKYDTKITSSKECLMNLRLVLASSETGALWTKTYNLAEQAHTLDPTDWEMFGAMGLLETLRGDVAEGKAKIEKAMASNSFIKMQYIYYYKLEPPYRRVLDKAGIDIVANEKSLSESERQILNNRMAREKAK